MPPLKHELEQSTPPRSGLVQQIAAGNAGWPVQFRFAVHVLWSRVPELWTFGGSNDYRIEVRELMTNKKVTILTMFGISALLMISAGCERTTKSSTGSLTVDGRKITYSIDGPASIEGTDPLIIKFGNHKLEKQGGNFLLDGRNVGGAGGTDKIDLVVSNSVLTIRSGSSAVDIPVTP